MSYYIMSEEDDSVLEMSEEMSEKIIKEAAEYFGCSVYAIRGEHSGYSASFVKEAAQQSVQQDLPVCTCNFQVAHDTLLIDLNCPVHGSASR